MNGLEVKLEITLVKEELEKLENLEKGSDYFKINKISRYFGIGNWFYNVDLRIYVTEHPLYENVSKLFLKLKEFGNKDSLKLDG